MLQKPENLFKTPLDAAIAHLKGKGVIRRDNDIADAIGYAKSVISGYKSGNAKISSDFKKKFENFYNIKLSDFGDVSSSINDISLLNDIVANLKTISRSLIDIQNGQAYIRAEIRGFGQYQIMEDVKWDQKKYEEAMAKVGRLVGANLTVDAGNDSSGK